MLFMEISVVIHNFCPECNNLDSQCDSVLHHAFTNSEVWEYALQGGILHGSEYEDLDPYK